MIVPRAYDHCTSSFGPHDHLKSCVFCKISVWPPHDARIFFRFVISPH